MGLVTIADMIAEIDAKMRATNKWLAEYNFLPCDLPNCVHPNCRGKSVAERKAEGPIVVLT